MRALFLFILTAASIEAMASGALPVGSLCEDLKGNSVEITGYSGRKYTVKRYGREFNYIGTGKISEWKLKNCQSFTSLETVKSNLFRVIDSVPADEDEEQVETVKSEEPSDPQT